jgi:hypothetical protein
MSKYMIAVLVTIFAILAGCKDDKGHGFIGHWVGEKAAERKSVDISFSDGVYHVDFSYPDAFSGEKVEVNKLEGMAVSDSVLMIHGTFGDVSMRLEGDTVSIEDKTYRKSK